jgi:hypothetical protein
MLGSRSAGVDVREIDGGVLMIAPSLAMIVFATTILGPAPTAADCAAPRTTNTRTERSEKMMGRTPLRRSGYLSTNTGRRPLPHQL